MQVASNIPHVAPGTSAPQDSTTTDNASKQNPKAKLSLNNCRPEYPRAALNANESGTVRIRFIVSADDQLMAAYIVKSSGFQYLDQAAIAKLNLCKFKTARTADGKPIVSSFMVDYVWDLAD